MILRMSFRLNLLKSPYDRAFELEDSALNGYDGKADDLYLAIDDDAAVALPLQPVAYNYEPTFQLLQR